MDEQWSYVGSKKNQRWLFYAWEPRFKRVLAHAFGKRTRETLRRLLKKLEPFMEKISYVCTDGWESYATNLPDEKHITGKYFTQRIERENLNIRTRIKRLARRTICYSRSEEIHDQVIGEYMRREHYQLI